MANRFRAAIKGTTQEILSAGKPFVVQEEPAVTEQKAVTQEAEQKEVEPVVKEIVPEEVKREALPSYGDFTQEKVSAFLKQKINNNIFELRMSRIKDILNALIDYQNSKKPVLLCDYVENIPSWIAAVKMSLPNKVASTLAFRTYRSNKSNDLQNCLIFINSEEDKANNKNFSDEDSSVVVFDFSTGFCARVQFNSKYSEMVQVGYMLNDQSVQAFEKFINEFNYTNVGPDIDSCLELYYIINNGVQHMPYNLVEAAMEFINRYAVRETNKILLQRMNVVVARAGESIDGDVAFALIKTIVVMANKVNEEAHLNMAYKFFYTQLKNLLTKTDESKIAIVFDFYNNIKDIKENNYNNFVAYTLGEENIKKMTSHVVERDPKFAKFYLKVALDVAKNSNARLTNNVVFEQFISNCTDRLLKSNVDIRTIISNFSGNLRYMANLMVMYYAKVEESEYSRKEAIKFYMEKAAELGNQSHELRNLIFAHPKGKDLIFYEFATNLSRAEKKNEYFWRYNVEVFDKINGFKKVYFSDVLENYLNLIKNEPIYKEECLKIVIMASKNEVSLSNETLTKIIQDYENEIPLGTTDKEMKVVMVSLSNIKKARNIKTANNVAALTEFGIRLENANNYKDVLSLINGPLPELSKVSEGKYREFLEWCIRLLLDNESVKITDTLNFFKKLTSTKENGDSIFIHSALNAERLNMLRSRLKDMKAKHIQFYMIILMNTLVKNQQNWRNDGISEMFIYDCTDVLSHQSKELYIVLDCIAESEQYFANILNRYYNGVKGNGIDAIRFFVDRTRKNGEKWANDVRTVISTLDNGYSLLKDEFKILFDSFKDKTYYFWNYCNSIFANLPQYKAKCFSDVFEYYLKHIEKTDKYTEECINVLELVADEKVILSGPVLSRIVKEYESTIPLVYPSEQTLSIIDEIEAIKYRNGVVVEPQLGAIIKIGMQINDIGNSEGIIQLLTSSTILLDEVKSQRYAEYLNWCMPNLFRKINVIDNLDIVKKVMYSENHREIFSKVYNELLFNQIKSGSLVASRNELLNLFKTMNLSTEELCNILISYYHKDREKNSDEPKESIGLFMDIIDSRNLDTALEMRKYIAGLPEGKQMLFEEYTINLNVATNAQKFFWRYVRNVFNLIPNYKEEYFIQAINLYMDSIEGTEEYPKVCQELITMVKDGTEQLGYDLEKRIIAGCELMLSLSQSIESQEELIRFIEEVKKARNITTSPDLISLIKFSSDFEKVNDMDNMHKLLEETNLTIDDMDIIKYEEFLDHFLPKAALCVNSWNMHATVKKVFCIEKRKALFFTKYVAILADNIQIDKVLGGRIFAEFVIYFFNSREQQGEELYVQIKANFINIMYRLSPAILKDINNHLKTEINNLKNKDFIMNNWDQMYSKVVPNAKSEGGFFGRFFN